MVREVLTLERLCAMPSDEAAALLAVRRAEAHSTYDQALLAAWLDADPANASAFASVERGWAAFDGSDDDEILAAMRTHALAPRHRPWHGWSQIAAVAALLLFVAMGSWWAAAVLPSRGGQEAQQVAWTRYAAQSQLRTVVLADGSTMVLDAGSVAEARFMADARSIRLLRGRALFEVNHDPKRPFAVTASTRRVVALGTRFAIDMGGDALKVMLLRGKVAVEPTQTHAETVTLLPGQRFVERAGSASVETMAAIENPAWSRGLVDFADVPLGTAVAEINRYAGTRIVVGDPRVAALRISGQFHAGEPERFASTVAELHGLRVVRGSGEIALMRK